MKIAIYGAGAIGGWIGSRLALAGESVSVVARGATLESLRKSGLRLVTSEGTFTTRVHAVADPDSAGPQDLVVIAVKAPAMQEVARGIAPLIGPETVVLTAMNGVPWWFFESFGGALTGTRLNSVDPGGAIADAIPSKQVVGCVVHASCSVDTPGVVREHFGKKLIVGEPSGERTPRIRELVTLLERAGFEAVLSERIQKDTWYKLWGNMTINPVSAITGATIDRIVGDREVREFISRVMREARDIGERMGLPIAEEPEDRLQLLKALGAFKSSMLQDVDAGRPVELDALVTVVCELGQLTGVPTPCTNGLLGLARLHAQVHGLY
jgi:2-dehydropantoate 2-reductase